MAQRRIFLPVPDQRLRDWLPLLFGLFLVVLVGAMSARLVLMHRDHNADVVRSLELIRVGQEVDLHLRAATAYQRGYMLTGQRTFQDRYEASVRSLETSVGLLEELTGSEVSERGLLMSVKKPVEARVAELGAVDRLIQNGQAQEAAKRVLFALVQVDAVRRNLDNLIAQEREILQLRHERAEQSGNWLLVLTVVGLGLAILLVGSSIAKLRRRAADLQAANTEVRALNEGLEARVAERTVELVEANAEIQRFAHVISHDLRAPLINIVGFTSELQEAQGTADAMLHRLDGIHPNLVAAPEREAITEDMPEAIGFIRASSVRMDRLIKAILDLSRSGRREISAEDVDLSSLIAGLSATLRTQLEAADVTFTVAPLPVIESDRLALEQVFGNLLDNAVKYLRPGVPGTISITAQEEADAVRVHVEDNGRGVAPRDIERVFDLFRRAGPQDQPGEGVGLAHVRALVRRLGGSIALESREGEGSRFTVTLPRRISDVIQSRGY